VPHPEVGTSEAFLHALARIFQAEERHSQLLVKKLNITKPQLLVLKAVGDTRGAYITSIAKQIRVSQATVSGVIARLIDKGLLRSRAVSNDRRLRTVFLTEQGESLLKSVPSLLAPHFCERLRALPAWQGQMLSQCLRRLADLMD